MPKPSTSLPLRISRLIVGVLFIFSGLVKANDPLGLSYKMQEFFEIWGWHSLNDFTLALSIGMITFEIIAGIAVLVGWKMNLFSWLLLLLTIFFTFLTGYAVFSGKIKECGCFGNCIPLTANQSFYKDLILMVFIFFIFANRFKIRSRVSSNFAMAALSVSLVFTLGFQWYVLRYLPLVDCLPYKLGKNISTEMKLPEGAIPDSMSIGFVYEKGGKELSFTADKFPEDFNETDYHFVRREDKLIRKGNADIPIKDFSLVTLGGTDTTEAILTAAGYTGLFFTMGLPPEVPGWNAEFMQLQSALEKKKGTLNIITHDYDNIARWTKANSLPSTYPILKCDFVAVKTAARANPTFYLLKQGTILGKWSYANFDKAAKFINQLKD